MKAVTKLVLVPWILVGSSICSAQEISNLECKGELRTESDYAPSNQTQMTSVDVRLDPQQKVISIDGWWGCVAHLGEDFASAKKCGPNLPVVITESAVEYFGNSANEKYQGSTVVTINRFSGRMTVFSNATALPPAGAKWGHMMINGQFTCKSSKKLF